MNFVAKCCQPPGILGDLAVDRWKFIDFTRPGILRPSPCTDKKWNSPIPTGYIPPGQPPGISSKRLPGGSGFDF